LVGSFVGRKLWYTYPSRVAAVAETTHDPAVAAEGEKFVRAAGVSGLFQVELKRSDRDGRLYLIEMNQRNWLWGELASACGANLPLIKFDIESGSEVGDDALSPMSSGIFVNEYGVLTNIWGYKSLRPLWFVARAVVSRANVSFALLRRDDLGPARSAIGSLLPRRQTR